MPNYDEIIKQSQENIKRLNNKLVEFDNLYKYIIDLTSQPEVYDNKFKEIIKLTEKYTNILGASSKKYIDSTDTLLSAKITELGEKSSALQKEITRLADTDIADLFNSLQNAFIAESKRSLNKELSKFENHSDQSFTKFKDTYSNVIVELQLKISELQKEISRLEKIDFTDLFNNLKNTFLTQSKSSIESELNKFENNTTKLLKKNDSLHSKFISNLEHKTDELQKEITRLTETDITNLFNDLKKAFIEQASKDLSVELNKIDEKTEVLQTVIEGIQKEATRLEEIDLEKHFVKHQKTLSEIFGAVNSINTVLSGITQTLTGITQGIGNLQNSYDEKHKESKQQIESYGSQISSLLTNQSSEIKKTTDILNVEVEIIKEQNRNLKKESKTMRIIQIIEIAVILSAIIYTVLSKFSYFI